jgi:hypothetical protein
MNGGSELATLEPANESSTRPRELSAKDLRFEAKIAGKFASTRDLSGAREFVGQERALAALELVLGVGSSGYNIFVSGLTGDDKLETLRRWIAERVSSSATPGDWVYVLNLKQPDAPAAIYLKAGDGKRLKVMMRELVKTLRDELPKAFRQEAFDNEKVSLTEKYNNRAQEPNTHFAALARDRGDGILEL